MKGKTVPELQNMLSSGSISSRELCSEALARIGSLDKTGPCLNAMIELNPEALDIAEKLDRERERGELRSMLHGIPVVIKDNIDTGDAMKTTTGSLALSDFPAPEDAFIVGRLRDAGAVILGKSNLSEWANFRSMKSSSGWSSRGGQTLNPYDFSRSPCGSSSGSAVAVAAGYVPLAVGTETDGSIICPSAHNSVVGIKPTRGSVSRRGIIPISFTQDIAGPMAATVEDAAVLLSVLWGEDPGDSQTVSGKPCPVSFPPADHGLDQWSLDPRDIVIGAVIDTSMMDARAEQLFYEQADHLEKRGFTVKRDLRISKLHEYSMAEMQVMRYEFKDGINRYLRERGGRMQSLDDLIRFNADHPDTVMPIFGQDQFLSSRDRGGLDDPEYLEALQECGILAITQGIEALFQESGADVLIYPSNGPAWKIDHINGDRYTGGNSSIAAVSGYPSITVPAGYIEGLPAGLTFTAPPWQELKMLRCAKLFQDSTRARIVPRFP